MFIRESRSTVLQNVQTIVNKYKTLKLAYEHIEPLLLGVFGAERMSIFQRRTHHRDLVARFKTGDEIREIKVPINTQSISGYVAMAQQGVKVTNLYDEQELKSIHYKLRFDKRYDRVNAYKTSNILAVPIKNKGVILGVLEVLNKIESSFTDDDLVFASQLADIIGQAYKYEIGGTSKPFDYLVHKGLLDAKILSNIATNSNIKHLAFLLNSEYRISEHNIGESLSIYYQVPFVDYKPDDYHLTQGDIKLNRSYLKRNLVAILRDNREQPIVLMFEPNNIALLMEIESALGTDNYQLACSLPNIILRYLGESNLINNATKFDEIIGEIDTSTITEEKSQEVVTGDEPAIVRLVSNILTEAKRLNASDIHIDPEPESASLVRMRVDGIVRDINQVPESHHNAVISRIKIMSGLNISEKRMPQDGKLMFKMSGQTIEVRVATIPTVHGEGAVMRLLAGGTAMPIEKINLSPNNLERLEAAVAMPHGILLVVGPTGSGKTTTLHAILGHLNIPGKKIWTAEDPVEITQYRLQQVQVNPKIGLTFANALRAFLRADPDVILIGEMRDKETASAAIEASLTGHLVLSTLHTNSASETITRLLDLGIDPVNFSDACVGIVAQRLVRVLCTKCKQSYEPSEPELAFLRRQYGEQYCHEIGLDKPLSLYKAIGCRECDDTGYKGRTGVHELLTMTPDLRSLVYKGASIADIKHQAMNDGMRTLVQDAVQKVLSGETDVAQMQVLCGGSLSPHK